MADCVSLSLVAAALAIAAGYGALILKESVAMPCEAFSSRSFRHGPLRRLAPRLASSSWPRRDRARELGIRLALDTSQLGSRRRVRPHCPPPRNFELRCHDAPRRRRGPCADTLSSVLIQRLAAALARQRGVRGHPAAVDKVTETE